jgi:tetratricopeptide (TPR) repeat protein
MDPLDLSTELSQKTIRRVFRDWTSLKMLGGNPLSDLSVVNTHRQAAGFSESVIGRGLALRKVFMAALDALKPDEGSPNLNEKRWRPYIILTEQYLHGRNPDWVKEQLHVSKATYYGEQERALDRFAEILQKWELDPLNILGEKSPELKNDSAEKPRVPFMVPSRPSIPLIGRDELLHQLKQQLMETGKQAIATLDGLPGVGKTAIAVELAHDPEVQDYFQDGILWSSLGRQPDVLSLLGGWAAAVGVSAEALAGRTSIAERGALIHAALGMRRMLLILDDAWQVEAALALKLGGPNCAYLLTTRLAEIALDFTSGQTITVHELDQKDAARLLAQIAPRATKAAPHEFENLIYSMGGLPLALILIGRYLEKQSYRAQFRRLQQALTNLEIPEVRLKISQPASPLDNLHPNLPLGTPLSLHAMIGLSVETLDTVAYQALTDLSIFLPKPNSFSEEAALAVINLPGSVLDRLVDSGLVECTGNDRYTLHQTIWDYASIQGVRPEAVERLVEYMVGYVKETGDQYKNLDLELANVLTALDLTVRSKDFARINHFLNLLFPFLETRGLYPVAEKYLKIASELVAMMGDQVSQAEVQYKLGDLYTRMAQFKVAQAYLQRCIQLAQATQSRYLEAKSLFQLGLACHYAGDVLSGRSYLEQSLQIDRELGLKFEEGFALVAIGFASEELCHYGLAQTILEQALGMCITSGNRRGEGWAHYNLSMVYLPMGDFPLAWAHSEECHRVYRELGDRRGEGWLIYHQGRIYRQQEKFDQARACFEQASQILSELGDWMGFGFAVHNLGLIAADLGEDSSAQLQIEQALEIFQRVDCVGISQANHSLGILRRRHGDYAGAIPYFQHALRYRREIGYRRGEAMAMANLGWISHTLGDSSVALEMIRRALSMIEEIGARPNLARVLTFLGQIQLDLGRFEEAAQSYQRAWMLRKRLGQPRLALEPLAGLARASLLMGCSSQALLQIKVILGYLQGENGAMSMKYLLAGIDSPLRVFLTCYQILSANEDLRAPQVLDEAGQFLRWRSSQIPDEVQRGLFLERVNENRELTELLAFKKA